MKKITRRQFMQTAGVAALASAASACSGAGGKQVELEFVQWWTSENAEQSIYDITDAFEAENSNIKITYVELPFGEVRNQVVASDAAKSSFDIIGMNPPWTREFYDLGILAPLDDLIAADDSFNKADFTASAFAPIDGKAYTAPVSNTAFFLFCNLDMFDEAGLDVPQNFADIAAAAKAMTNGNKYGITLTMSEQEASNGSILTMYPLLYAQNGRTIDGDKFTVETPEMQNVLDLFATFAADGSMLPGMSSRSEVANMEEFSTGNVGMMISHNGHIETVRTRNPDMNFCIMPIPSFDGSGKPELRHHGWDIAISADCEHKEEAWKYISYLLKKENVEKLSNECKTLPVRLDAEIAWAAEDDLAGPAVNFVQEYAMVEELALMPQATTCWTHLTVAGSKVLKGEMSAADAIASVQASWNEEIGQ